MNRLKKIMAEPAPAHMDWQGGIGRLKRERDAAAADLADALAELTALREAVIDATCDAYEKLSQQELDLAEKPQETATMRTADDVIKDWQKRDFVLSKDARIMLAEVLQLRARLAEAERLAASVRQVKAWMIEQGIGPDNVEREMFEMEAAYTAKKEPHHETK